MVRAKETCSIIADELPSTIPKIFDSDLEEGNFILPQQRERFERVLKKYFVPSQGPHMEAEVIISHGNMIRYLVCR